MHSFNDGLKDKTFTKCRTIPMKYKKKSLKKINLGGKNEG